MNDAQNTNETSVNKGFDIDLLDSIDQSVVTHRISLLQDEDGNDKSGVIIVGKNSPQFQTVTAEIRKLNIFKAQKRGRAMDGTTEEGAAAMTRSIAAQERKIAEAITVDWFGFEKGGISIPLDKAILSKMFDRFPHWITRIHAGLDTDANFMKA